MLKQARPPGRDGGGYESISQPLFLKIHERWYLKPRNPASPVTVSSDIFMLVSQNTSSFHPRLRQNLWLKFQKRRRPLLAPTWWVLGLVAPWQGLQACGACAYFLPHFSIWRSGSHWDRLTHSYTEEEIPFPQLKWHSCPQDSPYSHILQLPIPY